MHDAVKRQATT